MAKDALYDAEDVLDDLATEALKSKLETNAQTNNTNQVNQWRPRLSSPLSSPFSRGIDKLNKIIEKLEFIAKYKDILGLNDDVKGRLSLTKLKLPTTTSLVDESCVYGRDRDKKTILELLLMNEPSSNNKIGVIPIVGMGGVGKTMLAQLVYNDDQVQKHFDLRVWVCVSDQVDVLRVTTTILKSVTLKSTAHLDDLNLLQVSLRENLLGKKFLLVLDDVWSRRNNDWDLIWNPLKAGERGSKIIVTTRDSNVAASMGTVPAHHLKCLSFEDCLAIFMNQAFENRNVYAFPSLEMIGTKIVNKCEGLPLAAKRLGILLRSRQEEEEWYDVLNRKIWALPDDESDIIQTLGLSYHHLPPHLKQCFAYCSIFPAGYEFDKDSLVLLWMAEGFVQQPKGTKKLEEVGNEYFHELVSRSFFQPSVHNNSLYVMHSLMKDLAHFVTGDFSFQLEDKVMDDDQNTTFDKARHSSYLRSRRELLTKFEVFNGAECLRTFLPLDPTGEIGASYLANEVPCELLPKLKNLRVLSFSACRISELPSSIGALKHLRYMDLSRTAIKRLPDSTGNLYNLQTLILLECFSLCKLPMEIGNLTCLRHLRISETRLREMPLQMYRLKNLQTLSHFVVGKDSGSGIRDLRDMKQLQGTLLISGLQNVISFIDAVEANLKDKKGLARLVFQWNNSFDDSTNEKDEEEVYKEMSKPNRSQDLTNSKRFPSFREATRPNRQESVEFKSGQSGNLDDSRNERVEMDVFEMLQPHENIKELLVKDYGGTRFPSWIGSPLFCNMLVLELSNCGKCQILPSLGQLPSLKDLTVEGMEGIKTVGAEFYGDMSLSSLPFPSLETLKFENMSQWEVWYSSEVEALECFLRLENIEICNCPKLRRFSHRFPSLKRMIINGCQQLEAFPRILTLDSIEQGREFPCLRELSVSGCHNLMELPSLFPSLTTLEIDGCQDLELLPMLPSIVNIELNKCESKLLQSIFGSVSLTYMRLCKISNLECLVEGYLKHFTFLEELQISHLGELATLSNEIGLQSLLSLKLLEISGCPFLKELPQNLYKLSSLKVLRIWNCLSLVTFPVTGLPSTLMCLEIKSCEALQLLPVWMMHDSNMNERNTFSLKYLIIEGCPSLISLPREDELSANATLKEIEIEDCENLQSLPEKMVCNNTSLEILKVSGCHCIESFPRGAFQLPMPTIISSTVLELKELVISNCRNLQLLPEGLHNLALLVHFEIDRCPLLQSFPEPGLPASMLRSIRISNCQNLNRLPNRMYSLTCLQELSINGCSSIVSIPEGGLPAYLMSLSILDCENLKPSSEWGLHRLTCLTEFSFGGCESLVSFPEGWLLPTSVSSLHLERLPNLKSLPKGLKNLINCLETLEIWECDNLKTLPEKQPSTMLSNLWDAF
ncbi:hypothetical protein LWI28_006423 [Acer negundo]|uniref:Uncharacterized protein n=1 Tax=Acer negundo TaxID=4023 RepID=A0AAD5I9B4_ACENE|nr:hypothetical protein LWI28_006423 [Acer negundo]